MTEAQLLTLTQALRNANTEHRVFQAAPGDWVVQASSGTLVSTATLQNLEIAHGVVARTNRAQFQ
jgi:hypothetical protein